MKICFFAEIYNPIISGTAILLQQLTKELQLFGHEIYTITPSYPGYRDFDVNVVRYPALMFFPKFGFPIGIPTYRFISHRLQVIHPDVLHVQQPFWLGGIAQKYAIAHHLPFVTTIQTDYTHDGYLHYLSPIPKNIARHIIQKRLRIFCNNSDIVITPAKGMEQKLVTFGVTSPINIISNGINVEKFHTVDGHFIRKKLGYKDDDIILIFLGRIAEEKNLEFLIRCIALIRKSSNRIKLLVVGDGPYQKTLLNKISQLNLFDVITCIGTIPHENVPPYYAAADIFVLPSITEVNSLVLLEAQAAGLPVIAIKSYNALEVLTNGLNSILTGPAEDEFVRAIMLLAENSILRKNMSLGAKKSGNNHSIKNQINALLKIYSELIDH